jgi:pimeloyl-[acyl-carrier protein] methyl ester esterase
MEIPGRKMIGFALCHGWSFDADAMHALAENLGARFPDAPIAAFDLGFTGKPHAPSLDALSNDETHWVAIGHSYGFPYLMQQPIAWRAAISVNGFTRFCRRPGKPAGTPQRLVDAMLARLKTQAQATVEEFRQRCGSADPVPQQLDAARLHAHLIQLRDLDLSPPAYPVLSLFTSDDLIVPPSLSHACFAPPHCTLHEYQGSHVQLLQDPQQCMTEIAAFVEANRA